jgi:hypothetical protein
MTNIKNLAVRTGAVFVSSALATIGVGSIFGINAAIAAGMAGVLAVAKVTKDLADAMIDGKLTKSEIDAAFQKADPKGKK